MLETLIAGAVLGGLWSGFRGALEEASPRLRMAVAVAGSTVHYFPGLGLHRQDRHWLDPPVLDPWGRPFLHDSDLVDQGIGWSHVVRPSRGIYSVGPDGLRGSNDDFFLSTGERVLGDWVRNRIPVALACLLALWSWCRATRLLERPRAASTLLELARALALAVPTAILSGASVAVLLRTEPCWSRVVSPALTGWKHVELTLGLAWMTVCFAWCLMRRLDRPLEAGQR